MSRNRSGFTDASRKAGRASRVRPWLDGACHDLRPALRALLRERSFALATVLMLALALALNATAFRVLDTLLLRGYPLVKDNDRLLYIGERSPNAGCCVSYFDFEHWQREAPSLQEMAFMAPRSISLAEGDGDGRTLWVFGFTTNFFRLAGVAPALGRDFEPADAVPGAPRVAIANHGYWQGRLGGSPDVIGRTVRMDGEPVTIVGVMPEGFDFPDKRDVWLPLVDAPELHQRGLNGGEVYGRLAPGATEAQARVELQAINERLGREYPDSNRGVVPVVESYRERLGPVATVFYGSLWLGAWFVLLIACANAANLALARAQERTRELSTRIALGSGRERLVRQLFVEHLCLCAIAGGAAWWLAAVATRTWAAATSTPYSAYDYAPTAGTSLYLAAVTLAVAVLITLAPVAHLWRIDVHGALKGARSSALSPRTKRIANVLVVGQMALAVVLIAGAGVLGRSVWNVVSADVGVASPERVVLGQVTLPRERYDTAESRLRFFDALKARLGALPGVEVAAVGDARPLDDFEPRAVELESRGGERHDAPIFASGPDYFAAIGSSVVLGRDFSAVDRPGAGATAIVNQRFAEAYFGGSNPLGQRLRIYEKYQLEPGEWRTVVGVVANVMQNEETRQRFQPAVYLPLAQQASESVWFFARTARLWDGIAAAVRAELAELDPKLEIADYSTLKATLGLGLDSARGFGKVRDLSKNALIAPVYAALAVLLAAIGLYAVVARSVGQRRGEIGVRAALGATPSRIRRLVLVEGMTPVAIGLALGLAASLGVNRILQSQLIGVSPYDALTLTVAPVVLVVVALAGCLRPAHLAARVDPAETLRQD
jgi:putative ABC transport system permease protein